MEKLKAYVSDPKYGKPTAVMVTTVGGRLVADLTGGGEENQKYARLFAVAPEMFEILEVMTECEWDKIPVMMVKQWVQDARELVAKVKDN